MILAATFGLGAIFGGFFSAYFSSMIGRRKCVMAMALPDALGWILIASSKSIQVMMSGRFLNGFAAAGYLPAIQVCMFIKLISISFHSHQNYPMLLEP